MPTTMRAPSLLSIASTRRLSRTSAPWLVTADSSSDTSSIGTGTGTTESLEYDGNCACKNSRCENEDDNCVCLNCGGVEVNKLVNNISKNTSSLRDTSATSPADLPMKAQRRDQELVSTGSTRITLVQPNGDSRYKPPRDVFLADDVNAAFTFRKLGGSSIDAKSHDSSSIHDSSI
eukprot:CAMPEP_0198142226 /NCGR_PEP_ID=MMETSP1443-20131203/5084_1 /TAXON_ID=186043 /ORGANISM="Entomoneis sp., Strain CCMP2396" /LENGTH=175 /DNA_ID=CAMNT_0043805195 /DNA_START=58 /DNA_END=585 /DNA_ORIENTATION=+